LDSKIYNKKMEQYEYLISDTNVVNLIKEYSIMLAILKKFYIGFPHHIGFPHLKGIVNFVLNLKTDCNLNIIKPELINVIRQITECDFYTVKTLVEKEIEIRNKFKRNSC